MKSNINNSKIGMILLMIIFSLALVPNVFASIIGGFSQVRFVGNLSFNGTTLDLMTANASRLFITEAGLIGIGTLEPSESLVVMGNLSVNNSGGGGSILFADSTNNRIGIRKTTLSYMLEVGGGINASSLHIDGDGNITGVLTVGSFNVSGVVFSGGAVDIQGSLRVGGGANITGDLGVLGRLGVGTTTPELELQVIGGVNISGGLNVTEGDVLLATESGNVGIEDTSPETPLHISRNVAGNSRLISLYNTNGGADTRASIAFASTSGSGTHAEISSIRTNEIISGDTDLQFFTIGSNSLLEKLRITSSGKVGINTTSPANTFEVSGPTNLSNKDTSFRVTSEGNIVIHLE